MGTSYSAEKCTCAYYTVWFMTI